MAAWSACGMSGLTSPCCSCSGGTTAAVAAPTGPSACRPRSRPTGPWGPRVLIVGQGGRAQAADYAARHHLPCPVLCDPVRSVYEAYDLLEGKPSQIVFDAPDEFLKIDAEAGARLQQSRHGTPRAAVNSPWQLPGEFVIDTTGKVRLAHRYQHCEDWPNPLVLIAALKESVWAA